MKTRECIGKDAQHSFTKTIRKAPANAGHFFLDKRFRGDDHNPHSG
jgi:hypothetical protein